QSGTTWISGLLRTGTEEPGRAGHLRLENCDIPFPWPAFFGFRSGHFSCLLCIFGDYRSVKYIATRRHSAAEFHHPFLSPKRTEHFSPSFEHTAARHPGSPSLLSRRHTRATPRPTSGSGAIYCGEAAYLILRAAAARQRGT